MCENAMTLVSGVVLVIAALLLVGSLFPAVAPEAGAPAAEAEPVLLVGQAHADVKHGEAPMIRAQVRRGLCGAKELWFHPPSGRVLILCQLEVDPQVWGGWIIYVAQNNGQELLPIGHEATCFVALEQYWRGVIEREGYLPIAQYPRVLDHVTDMIF